MIYQNLQFNVARHIAREVSKAIINNSHTILRSSFISVESNGKTCTVELDVPDDIKKVKNIAFIDSEGVIMSSVNTTFDSAINTRIRYNINVELTK